MAMACWRASVDDLGLDLGDGGPALLDFRFADDILIFGNKLPSRRYIVGQTCGNFGGSGPSVECRKKI